MDSFADVDADRLVEVLAEFEVAARLDSLIETEVDSLVDWLD